MSLNVINTDNKVKVNDSFLGSNNWFSIRLYQNQFYMNNEPYWYLKDFMGFTAVSTEDLNLSFTTEWDDAGGAKLGKKITSFVNGSKIFKAFAAQSTGGFQPLILTDEWTQKKMKGGSPLKVSLKFRLYYNVNPVAGSSNYANVIRFFTHLCSPHKKVVLGTDIRNFITNTAEGFVAVGSDIYDNISNVFDDDRKSEKYKNMKTSTYIARKFGGLVNAVSNVYNAASDSWDGRNNGNFTVVFSFADKLPQNFIPTKYNAAVSTKKLVDWIVNSFSYTPSTQFWWDDKRKLPLPLWCDFNVELETRYSLSNISTYNILNKNSINFVEK